MYYIGTQTQCESYNIQVNNGENYSNDITHQWSEIIKHPTKDKYAIVKHSDYESNMELVESLSEDWIPKDNI